MSTFSDILKDRVSISSVVTRKTKLENRAGKLIGLCPFHSEKTPSFTVSDDKGFYYCFGCQASGDIFKFVMDTEKIDFLEAIKYIADFASIPMPKKEETQKYIEQENTNKTIYAVLESAKEWFKNQLKLTSASSARSYLANRKIDNNVINDFHIGYSPENKTALVKFLLSKNFPLSVIKSAGLSIDREDDIIDKFRNRIIFPIFDTRNQVIAFGGRTIGDGIPKYLNSPETVLFKKSEVLYAENIAKIHAHKNGRIIVVEGYMDVIALHKHGIKETVATLGTAFSESHLSRLWKLADEPLICLDGDIAGIRAMKRAAEITFPLLIEGKSLNFVILPDGKDPDDIIGERGREYFAELLTKPIALSEVMWLNEKDKITSTTPEQISMLEKRLNDQVVNIKNHRVRKNYQNYFKSKIWELTKSLNSKNSKNFLQQYPQNLPKNIDSLDIIARYEYILIAEIINEPKLLLIDYIKEELIRIDFCTNFLTKIRILLLEYVVNIEDEELLDNLQSKEILCQNNLEQEYELLCGKNSSFIDIISKSDVSEKAMKWQLIFKRYHLSLIEKEYNLNLIKPNNEDVIINLRNEINLIRESIKKQESLFEKY